MLYLFGADTATVDLRSTQVSYISGDGDQISLDLGTQATQSIDLFADTNNVTSGSGAIGNLFLRGEVNTFDISTYVGKIDLGGPNGSTSSGVIREDAQVIALNAQQTQLNMTVEGILESLKMDQAGGNFFVTNTGTIYQAKLDNGDYGIVANGFIDSLSSYGGELDLTLTKGVGALQITAAGEGQSHNHSITVDGFFGSIRVLDDRTDLTDNQNTNLLVDADGGTIKLGHGNDFVTIGGNNGWVSLPRVAVTT